MTKKLDILEQSLIKKNIKLDNLFETHFDTVRQANGQPLNDKRNGVATLAKWDKQSDSIAKQKLEVAKTEQAIHYEQSTIQDVEDKFNGLPASIQSLINDGVLIQWRKHPNILFVDGVDKARIKYNTKTNKISYSYIKQVTDKEQYRQFASVYNQLRASLEVA